MFVIQEDAGKGRVGTRVETVDMVLSDAAAVGRSAYIGVTIPGRRFVVAASMLLAMMGGVAARAAHIQLIEGDAYRVRAEGNRVRVVRDVPPRGVITDRHGTVLAKNVPSFVLLLTYADLPSDPERGTVLDRVSALAGVTRTDLDLLLTQANRAPDEPMIVAKALSYEVAMRIAVEEPALPGFVLETGSLRAYGAPAKSLSHLLGYVGPMSREEYGTFRPLGYRASDEVGKAGVERGFEALLRGTPGETVYEVDAYGRELAVVDRRASLPGSDVTLTVDADLQLFIERTMAEAFERTGVRRGAVVAIDPSTGAIRALVSLPTYDNNAFAGGIGREAYARLLENPDRPLFPRAFAGVYPSGSTFKPFVAYAALAEGVVSERTTVNSVGGIAVGPWFFPDWRAGGHGLTDVRKAIAQSVNTYFYVIGGGYEGIVGLGVDRIVAYARRFGFGERTGLPIPGEADGFLPSKEWKREAKGENWYVGDTYNLSIGQGDLLATPLQMAVATARIANGGAALSPRLIGAVDGAGTAPQPQEVGQALDPAIVRIVREGMRATVTTGSARSLSALPIEVAGKTGTAQNISDRPTHAWFTGFAPYRDPTLAVAILLEEGGEGSSAAVPVAAEIFRWWSERGER